MSELIDKQKVLDALREIATEKFSLDDPYGVYINVLIDVEEKICRLPVVQPNGPDNLVKDSQGLAKDLVNDCISRKAAIDALDKRFDSIPMNQTTEILLLRKDLRELPSAQSETAERTAETAQNVSDEDLISRKAAIDAIRASTSKYTGFMEMEMYTDDDAVEAIEALPSAQPEPRTGKWLIRKFGDDGKCSVCGMYCGEYDLEGSDRYCRCCGAKMEGLEVSE